VGKRNSEADNALAYEWFLALDECQPDAELAKILDVTPRTVQRWRQMWRNDERPRYDHSWVRKVDPEKLKLAEKYVEDGMNLTEIERTLHISWKTLAKYFPDAAWTNEQVMDFVHTTKRLNKEIEEKY
jgi:transposase